MSDLTGATVKIINPCHPAFGAVGTVEEHGGTLLWVKTPRHSWDEGMVRVREVEVQRKGSEDESK